MSGNQDEIRTLFAEVLELPADARVAFLDQRCGIDTPLRARVDALLAAATRPGLEPASGGHGIVSQTQEIEESESLIGRTIGNYAVTALVGRGGMGRVYQGTDTRLGRTVALKVLGAGVVDEHLAARFRREARILASLNHPNIAAIYGVEEHGNQLWLILEFLKGRTLAERLAEGPLPEAQATAIARQISQALEAAHEQGVVHRDLKPGNVMLGDDGHVKVLDFGIAKTTRAVDAAVQPSRTDKLAATREGQLVGTPGYMSPESIRGLVVDRRADIWAFGIVLFEMLAGRGPFDSDDTALTLARVLESEPRWPLLPEHVPPRLRRLIGRCLVKDPTRRLQAIGEARLALEGDSESSDVPADALEGHRAARAARWVGVAALVLAAAWVGWTARGPVETSDTDRFVVPLAYARGQLSPDGETIIAARGRDVYAYSLVGGNERRLDGAVNSLNRFWSFDGRSIGFRRDDQLWRLDLAGGPARPVTDLPRVSFWGADWSDDDEIVFSLPEGLFAVPSDGGLVRQIYVRDPETMMPLRHPEVLPGGAVLVAVREEGRLDLVVDGERRTLLELADASVGRPRFSPPDRIVFARSSSFRTEIWAVPFSLEDLAITGDSYPVTTVGESPTVSATGSLMFSRWMLPEGQLTWLSRRGQQVGVVGARTRGLNAPRLSPDGRRIVASALAGEARRIVIIDVASGRQQQLSTIEVGGQDYPFWLHPGDRVGYTTLRRGVSSLAVRRLDGRDDPVQLGTALGVGGIRGTASPDGTEVVVERMSEVTGTDVLIAGADGGAIRPIVETPEHEGRPEVSPDGEWLAYQGGRTGFPGIFITDYPTGALRLPVSPRDGSSNSPRWSRDGRTLFFWSGATLMEVDFSVVDGRPFTSPPREVFSTIGTGLVAGVYDVSADGRFLMIHQDPQDPNVLPTAILLPNWRARIGR